MSLAREYSRLFRRNLLHFATWNPLTDAYEVGDFGLFRRGVFQKLGNVREFGVDPGAKPSASKVRFSYTSTGAVEAQTGAAAQTSAGGATATMSIGFQGSEAFHVRTQDLTVMEMPSVDAVARKLSRKRDGNGRKWNKRWRIVRKVYLAEDPVILASAEKATTFELSGSTDAISQLGLGKGSADISVKSNRGNTLEILGGKGPIAVDLFRVRVGGGAGLVSFSPGQEAEEEAEPELDDEWDDDDLDDDLDEGQDDDQ